MTRLTLADLEDEKPVRLTIEVSARLHRTLLAYAVALNGGDPKNAPAPERLISPMIERFVLNDRSFAKSRRSLRSDGPAQSE
ncbi:DUF2274 domain-containing protein [Sphingorhabdus sp. IMCC26285]|uniref:DUF2274 domain-containing protein n=1 Tax=Sphingorhabdus profundilacus TaxID=2509718 RepID=A0A6I4M264_9SPHN|nr:DUF2274 domain-containing protein [Sphingorhabdus profundilacus]MVZ98150.1 DUF2274 domain-containing protein [Sphingorhabdus profundilacus]